MWPDTLTGVRSVIEDMRARAARYGRELRFGYRAHVIVRATEAEARDAAARLLSRLDAETGEQIRRRSLDTTSVGNARQRELREMASRRRLGRARPVDRASAGPAPARAPRSSAIPIRCWPSCGPISELGLEAFILSGYPHVAEGDLFARHVLPGWTTGPCLRADGPGGRRARRGAGSRSSTSRATSGSAAPTTPAFTPAARKATAGSMRARRRPTSGSPAWTS